MPFCIICSFRRFNRSQQNNTGQQQVSPLELVKELEDTRKFSLDSLTILLAIIAISGFKTLQPVTLTLFIYIISLRLALSACFLQNYPNLSRLLHVLPLLATSCMAGVVLVTDVQSPGLATAGILFGVLPLFTVSIHHGRQCIKTPSAILPMQAQQAQPSSITFPVASN